MDLSPEPIIQIASGYMAAKQLFVAVEIGFFQSLAEGPAIVDDLAQRMGIPRRPLRIIADAAVALGLLERTGDRYHNSAAAGGVPERQWRRRPATVSPLIEWPELFPLDQARRSRPHRSNYFRRVRVYGRRTATL